MKIAFEDEARDLLQEFFPGIEVDQNAEHVTSESALIYYDDNKGYEYQVSMEILDEIDEDEENEVDGVTVYYSVYQRECGREDWNLIACDSREMDYMP
jgi:hypothetical protein